MRRQSTVRERRQTFRRSRTVVTSPASHPRFTVIGNAVERMFERLKNFRRIGTRYDRRADVYLSAVCLAAAVSYWL